MCGVECLSKLVLGFRALLSLNPLSLFILSGCNFISTALKNQSM